jgi:gamma-glutamyltranspeptidase / glutathione hydrolase
MSTDPSVQKSRLDATRATVQSKRGVVSSGHLFASLVGLDILRKGGNAIDAGIATGICINVVHHDMTCFAGVAPMAFYLAETNEVKTIAGLGRWPKAASLEYFWEHQDGLYEEGIKHCVVPAAPDAWTRALARYGTMTLEEVMSASVDYARNGVPVHNHMAQTFAHAEDALLKWPGSRAVAAPEGRVLKMGEMFIQGDLANTLQAMIDAEKNASGTREERIMAARDYFYKGDVAKRYVEFSDEHDGFFTLDDFAEFEAKEEPSVPIEYKGYEVHTCGPWCQGPVFAQALSLLRHHDVGSMEHNSAEYIHTVIEALNLAFADREFYYGDPEFVDVPMMELLDEAYTSQRAELIQSGKAWGELPPPGDPRNGKPTRSDYQWPPEGDWVSYRKQVESGMGIEPDTSYLCVVDSAGNYFSATPSDTFTTYMSPPIVPGLGLPLSGRGRQSRMDPNHPSKIEPWKRPRLTPSPAVVLKDGKPFMAIGTPGGDTQPQSMLQVFLNIVEFGMDAQSAVEAPRFITYSHPGSFYPHQYRPGLMRVEGRIGEDVTRTLESWGHTVIRWADRTERVGSVCVAGMPLENGVLHAGADNRREAAALGW